MIYFYDIIYISYYTIMNFKINYFILIKFIVIKNIDSKRIVTINNAMNNYIYYMTIKSAKKKKIEIIL